MAKKRKGRASHARRAAESVHSIVREPTRTLKRYPLPGTFMISGLVGFVASVVYTASGRFERWFGDIGLSLGVSFILVFMLMFIAALLSITPSSEETG